MDKKRRPKTQFGHSHSYVIFKDWSGQKIILKLVSNMYKTSDQ